MTELQGKELGAKLKDLLIVASDKIPAMAQIYGDSNGKLAGTSDGQDSAFYQHSRPESMGGGSESRIFGSWTALRDELQNVFGQTQANLNDTATAMTTVINNYANQDDAAAQGLQDAVADNNEDAYVEGENPGGDKNIPPLPPVGDGENPVDPPQTEDPIPSEENY